MPEQNETFQSKSDPKALQLLFNADPEDLTDADITTICQELRNQRAVFAKAEEDAANKPKTPRGGTSIGKAAASQLTLDDLI